LSGAWEIGQAAMVSEGFFPESQPHSDGSLIIFEECRPTSQKQVSNPCAFFSVHGRFRLSSRFHRH
jgi:hypothetical protein